MGSTKLITRGRLKIMIISKNTIFYFSGTGNSLQVSKDIALQLGDIDLISMPKIMNNDEIKVKSECIKRS
jgi:flavodoxin